MLFTFFVLMPAVLLFTVVNFIAGCLLAVHFNYGPPNWKLALNLIVDVTVVQQYLNVLLLKTRKYLFVEKTLRRLHIPEHVSIVPVRTIRRSETEPEQTENNAADEIEQPEQESIADTIDAEREKPEIEQVFFDKDLMAALTDKGTATWLMSDKNIETALIKLNVVQMQSGRFASQLDEKIRGAGSSITAEQVHHYILDLKDNCKHYLETLLKISGEVTQRIDEFGDQKSKIEAMRDVSLEHRKTLETALNELDGIKNASTPEAGGKMLIQEIDDLRLAQHKLRDMREQIFVRLAAKENRMDSMPKQLFVDDLTGLRGRIGIEAALADRWNKQYNNPQGSAFALVDFVNFGDANKKYGMAVCDKIIRSVGNSLKERFDTAGLTGVYAGNCFLIATHKLNSVKLAESIEQIRQQIEKTTFKLAERDVKITVQITAAVAAPAATVEATLTNLEKTLQAAKKDGKNRTFIGTPDGEPVKTAEKSFESELSEIML